MSVNYFSHRCEDPLRDMYGSASRYWKPVTILLSIIRRERGVFWNTDIAQCTTFKGLGVSIDAVAHSLENERMKESPRHLSL